MPDLFIRDLPEALHYRLKMRAAQNRRSMSQEAILLLEGVLLENEGGRSEPPAPFRGRFFINDEWLDKTKRK